MLASWPMAGLGVAEREVCAAKVVLAAAKMVAAGKVV